jgi:hypothetical protein
VAFESVALAVVALRSAYVAMACRVSYDVNGPAGFQGERHEAMPEIVRAYGPLDPGCSSEPADNPGSVEAIERASVIGEENGARHALPQGSLESVCHEGIERYPLGLASLAGDAEELVLALHAEIVSLHAAGFRYAQAQEPQESH